MKVGKSYKSHVPSHVPNHQASHVPDMVTSSTPVPDQSVHRSQNEKGEMPEFCPWPALKLSWDTGEIYEEIWETCGSIVPKKLSSVPLSAIDGECQLDDDMNRIPSGSG